MKDIALCPRDRNQKTISLRGLSMNPDSHCIYRYRIWSELTIYTHRLSCNFLEWRRKFNIRWRMIQKLLQIKFKHFGDHQFVPSLDQVVSITMFFLVRKCVWLNESRKFDENGNSPTLSFILGNHLITSMPRGIKNQSFRRYIISKHFFRDKTRKPIIYH